MPKCLAYRWCTVLGLGREHGRLLFHASRVSRSVKDGEVGVDSRMRLISRWQKRWCRRWRWWRTRRWIIYTIVGTHSRKINWGVHRLCDELHDYFFLVFLNSLQFSWEKRSDHMCKLGWWHPNDKYVVANSEVSTHAHLISDFLDLSSEATDLLRFRFSGNEVMGDTKAG